MDKQLIQDLVEERKQLKERKEFEKADEIRKRVEAQGYILRDTPDGKTDMSPIEQKKSDKNDNYVLLFGSGETTPVGRRIHEAVFQKIGKKEIKIALVSTPAGFQPNVHVVQEEIAVFFRDHLTNFHPHVDIVYANTHDEANNASIIAPVANADYIFIGPGSPTYAIRHLAGTQLLSTIISSVKNGKTLCSASAATIAFSQYSLPVYELYKVGADLHWEKGLDVYKELYRSITVVPHFNNNEGGEKTDTSFCYMGKPRFKKLWDLLPEKKNSIGIDEQTALVINLRTKEEIIQGLGTCHYAIPELL